MRLYPLALLLLLTFQGFGQTYRFNRYSMENGLPQNFIYTLSQDKNGYLWVGTGEGLTKFNGKEFITYTKDDGLAENVITCSYGINNKLYVGHNEGTISVVENNTCEILNFGNDTLKSSISALNMVNETLFFTTMNEGVYAYTNEELIEIGTFDKSIFSSLFAISEDSLLAGTENGIILITKSKNSWKQNLISLEDSWVSCIEPAEDYGDYYIGTENTGLHKISLANGTMEEVKYGIENTFTNYPIRHLLLDKDNNLWISTLGNGVIKISKDPLISNRKFLTEYNSSTGLVSTYAQCTFQDREGNIWIGTFGNGLFTLIDDYFTYFNNELAFTTNKNINCIASDFKYRYYGMDHGLLQIDANNNVVYHTDSTDWKDLKVTSLFVHNNMLWIGTDNDGVHSLNPETGKFNKLNWANDNLTKHVNQISGYFESLFIATDGGLLVYFIPGNSFEKFDTESGLAHNSIKAVFHSEDRKIWIGMKSRNLYAIQGSFMEKYEIETETEIEVVSITDDHNQNIWIATAENGVYKLSDGEFTHFDMQNGLLSNYTYSIIEDALGNIWVGHRGGLSRISEDINQIASYNYKDGIKEQFNPKAVNTDFQNYIWFGTNNGVIRYDPSKNIENKIPPTINITGIDISGTYYKTDEPIVLPYSNYRVKFDFDGISFKNPDKITYIYKLKGYDEIYSEPVNLSTITYGRLSEGDYEFEVFACNENNICSEEPATIKISIANPFWKTIWFYVIVVSLGLLIVYLIIRIRTKRITKAKLILEEKLEEKTKEVVIKAQQIEEINTDLTASINYAQRIQKSILPDKKHLEEIYPGSFIMFKPRDIVSGDFYYLDQCGSKLIVACVDCTGHGVPGGFVSMIGSTTLRNIYKTNKLQMLWQTPEQILEELDKQIEIILHQKRTTKEVDYYQSKDGMDLTLCEIDLNTKEVLISSAMRTCILQQDGKMDVIRGTKRPIGGGDTLSTPFKLERYQLKEGDALYLFSDGMTDQFGGPQGRKFKVAGIMSLIERINPKDSHFNETLFSQEFDSWKGELDQIDDVLMMGIQF